MQLGAAFGELDLAAVQPGGEGAGALRLVAGQGERFDQALGFARCPGQVGIGRGRRAQVRRAGGGPGRVRRGGSPAAGR